MEPTQRDPVFCQTNASGVGYAYYNAIEIAVHSSSVGGFLSYGWATENHYFYEIVNRIGDRVHIQLALSSKNAIGALLEICGRVSTLPFVRPRKDVWKWRTIFRTESVNIGLDKKEIFAKLDLCMEEVRAFEKEIKQALDEG